MDDLAQLLRGVPVSAIPDLVEGLPASVVTGLLAELGPSEGGIPASPLAQAREIDPVYTVRDHLTYLSERLTKAAEEVREHGISRRIVVSMPPRSGKSQLASIWLPVWLLRTNPKWKIGLISHDPTLATSWGRGIRALIEAHPGLGLKIARDAGAASEWQTTERGGVTSRSAPGQSITGRGFNILIVDDVVKDYAAAHSEANRKAVWEWWTANAETRLEPPSLVVVIGTRWHEDDFIGRLLSDEYDGDPADWEVISFPAIAEKDDVLGRKEGDPLLSPLIPKETPAQALVRWAGIARAVGAYAWAALFQQRPAPASGAVFNMDKFRYWTTDPRRVTEDGQVVLLDEARLKGARFLDSWDCAFKATDTSDYVVGQRWAVAGANRYLIDSQRGRWTFTQTLARMLAWAPGGPYAERVHERVVEDKANGTAIIDTLHDKVPGMKAVNPTTSKEARARAITPEVESGNVYLPHPTEHAWVSDLLAELRTFPSGAHDDQVDALTQALTELRVTGGAAIHNPADRVPAIPARTMTSTPRGNIRRGGGR